MKFIPAASARAIIWFTSCCASPAMLPHMEFCCRRSWCPGRFPTRTCRYRRVAYIASPSPFRVQWLYHLAGGGAMIRLLASSTKRTNAKGTSQYLCSTTEHRKRVGTAHIYHVKIGRAPLRERECNEV